MKNLLLPFNAFELALSFLSRIPCRKGLDWNDQRLWQWSFAFYPLVGALLGALACIPMLLLFKLPVTDSLLLVVTLFYLGASEWLTRLLHFDGLCDCADAFSAMALTKERRLEILKDSHAGSSAIGVGSLVMVGKALAFYLLVNKCAMVLDDIWLTIVLFIAIPAFARFLMLCVAASGTYPRSSGTAMKVVGNVPKLALLCSFLVVLCVASLAGLKASLLALMLCALVAVYWKSKADAKLGGVTGDVLGACVETCELVSALGFLMALESGLL